MPPARRRRTDSPRTLPKAFSPAPATTTPVRLRVATYRRASTDEDNQPYSLDVQQAKLASYIDSQDGMELVADYEERASGKDVEHRPQLLRLLEDAATGKFDTVLVYRIDRWSRRLEDLLATVAFLERHDVTFASATEAIDSKTNLGKMVLQLLGSFAEFERGLIVERVTRGIEAKLAKGLPLTSTVGFGLRVDAHGVVQADPDTFGIVQRIFTDYTDKRLGTNAIAAGLRADGAPTSGAAPWSAQAVGRVLRNRRFVGELPFRDGWVPGAHGLLMDPDVFDRAQHLADTRAQPQMAARAKGHFLLTGTITCAHCGGAYAGTTGTSSTGAKVRYYTCVRGRRYGKTTCANPSVPAVELETLVTQALLDTYADSDLFDEAINAHLAQRATQTGPLTAELTAAKTTARTKENLLRKYRTDYENGHLDASLYSTRSAELTDELNAARARAAHLEMTLAGDQNPTPTHADRKALHAQLMESVRTGSTPIRKALFAALVENLEVHSIDDIRPTFRVGGPRLPADEHTGHDHDQETKNGAFASHHIGWTSVESLRTPAHT